MKKVLALTLALMMVGSCAMAQELNFYADTFVVYEVDYDTDTVWLMDFNGRMISFEGCEDWFAGDLCSVLMDTCGTALVADDVIVSCQYSGWVSGEWGWDGNAPLCVF